MTQEEENFETPRHIPQFERDSGTQESLIDLMFAARGFNDTAGLFGPELVTLVRAHESTRSALLLPLEVAKQAADQLKSADDLKDIYRNQGAIQACERISNIILQVLQAAEQTKEDQHASHE